MSTWKKKRFSLVHYDGGGCAAPQSSVFFGTRVSPCRMQNASLDAHSFPMCTPKAGCLFVLIWFLFRRRKITWTSHTTTTTTKRQIFIGLSFTLGGAQWPPIDVLAFNFIYFSCAVLRCDCDFIFAASSRCYWAILMITFGSRCENGVFGCSILFCADAKCYPLPALSHSVIFI